MVHMVYVMVVCDDFFLNRSLSRGCMTKIQNALAGYALCDTH